MQSSSKKALVPIASSPPPQIPSRRKQAPAVPPWVLHAKIAELTQVVHILFTKSNRLEHVIDKFKEASKTEVERLLSIMTESDKHWKDTLAQEKTHSEELQATITALKRELGTCHVAMRRGQGGEEENDGNVNEAKVEEKAGVSEEEELREKNQQLKEQLVEKTFEVQKCTATLRNQEKKMSHLVADNSELQKKLTHHLTRTEESWTLMQEKLNQYAVDMKQSDSKLTYYRHEVERLKLKLLSLEQPSSSANRKRMATKNGVDIIFGLKEENRWLRAELQNREHNYNRVFSEVQPVFVAEPLRGHPRGSLGGGKSPTLFSTGGSSSGPLVTRNGINRIDQRLPKLIDEHPHNALPNLLPPSGGSLRAVELIQGRIRLTNNNTALLPPPAMDTSKLFEEPNTTTRNT